MGGASLGLRGERRGCAEGYFACLLSNECAESCAASCPGADREDPIEHQCIESLITAASQLELNDTSLMVGNSKVDVSTTDTYFMSQHASVTSAQQAIMADALMMVALQKHRLIAPSAATSSTCNMLKNDAMNCILQGSRCVCSYESQQTCSKWFSGDKHLRPIIGRSGMVIVAGEGCECNDQTCSFALMDEVPGVVKLADDTQGS